MIDKDIDGSTGFYSGQSLQVVLSLLGCSSSSSINMVHSLNLLIMVVSPFFSSVWVLWSNFPLPYITLARWGGKGGYKYRKEVQTLMKGFSWLPVIDQSVIVACQIFNLERSYRINNQKWVLYLISPFMYVPLPRSRLLNLKEKNIDGKKWLMVGLRLPVW